VDLDAYFARIGYSGPRDVSPETLRALQFAHVSSVPFENLDILLGQRIRLEPDAIFQKLVTNRRGGYCFEQNSLFRDVLQSLGFQVTPLLARVRWQTPPGLKTPLTHMVLLVDVAGERWLADVGFGGVGATAPLALGTESPQATSHDNRRLLRQDDTVVHQLWQGGQWSDVYAFRLEEPAPLDFEMGNLFSCTHPQARFLNCLVVTLVRPDRRVIVFNRELIWRHRDGRVESRTIESPEDLLQILGEHYGLHFPPGTRFGPPGSAWPS
jgi:N-hydroxyarylamine O-acetyltransferase